MGDMAALIGFEPMRDGTKNRCLAAWLQGNKWWRVRDSNPRTRKGDDLQSPTFGHFDNPPLNLMPFDYIQKTNFLHKKN